MNEIWTALERCRNERKPCVIATIIEVEGSAYRREGARCVIHEDGEIVGILSGGCLEDDVREHAFGVLETGSPRTLRYDFRGQEDNVWGLGAGCNGAITVWLELFHPVRHPEAAALVMQELERRKTCASPYYAVTVMESEAPELMPVGSRWRFTEEQRSQPLPDVPLSEASPVPLPRDRAGLVEWKLPGRAFRLFVEKVTPPPRLSIIGTNADAAMLCRMAKSFEWHVSMVYHQTAKASADFFPEADEIIHVPRGHFADFPIYPDHSVVVMTHNLELDLAAVRQLLPRPVSYLGVLGSRQRIGRILEMIRSDGTSALHSGMLEKLHAPIGLDIGASTPEEITLSIMAELIASKNGRSGGFLKNRRG
jgi:xanthine dehydrogenase accessory factor